jgi:AcrR family transcriptional regulator
MGAANGREPGGYGCARRAVAPAFPSGFSPILLIHRLVNYRAVAARSSTVVEFRSRDADRTREEILRAAMAEFAAHGFGGARMEAIAERSGVNKKLIYYYFAGKDELFLAVLEQTYADIRSAERELHLETSDPLAAIRTLVAFTWHYYLDHPEFLALLNSENMHRAGHLKRSRRIRQMNSPLIEVLADVLARGEKSGELQRGIDAMQLYISIAGLAYFYLSNNHTLSAIFGRELMTPAARAARLAHMCAVILGYVAAPKGAAAKARAVAPRPSAATLRRQR